ncbi:MAG TPA: hypothetical protein PLQ93_07725 [Bacteroidia bacterium]|nr:hypothetical protein [Bacteroidia bacterium]
MIKTFTPNFISEQSKQSRESLAEADKSDSQTFQNEPSAQCLKNIMAFSRSLQVKPSRLLGRFETICN